MLSGRQLTQVHRRQQIALRAATRREVARLWPALDWTNLDASYPAFAAEVAALVARNRRTSAGVAAAYLRAFRVASGLDGDLRIALPDALPREQFATSLRVTSIVAAKRSASNGVDPDAAMNNALAMASGAMARLVLNGGRDTVTRTIATDPQAKGWTRVLGGGGCDFCRPRAGVRMTSAEVFEAHDHCACTAEPRY